jgi:hypothetical protein
LFKPKNVKTSLNYFLQSQSLNKSLPVKQNVKSNGKPKACQLAKKFLEST